MKLLNDIHSSLNSEVFLLYSLASNVLCGFKMGRKKKMIFWGNKLQVSICSKIVSENFVNTNFERRDKTFSRVRNICLDRMISVLHLTLDENPRIVVEE